MTPAESTRSTGRFWAFVPVVLLAALVSVQLVLVRAAVHDPSFSIEDRYYAKAVSWDRKRAQDADNARLGWRLNLFWSEQPRGETELILRPVDSAGLALTGARIEVEGFAVSRSSAVSRAVFVEGPDGSYTARLRTLRRGLWELSFSVRRGAETLTSVQRADLPGEGAR